MDAQLTRRTEPAKRSTPMLPPIGRAAVDARLPFDDDSAPYPAVGGFFWDQLLREKRGPVSRD